jgi:hypothetical protein
MRAFHEKSNLEFKVNADSGEETGGIQRDFRESSPGNGFLVFRNKNAPPVFDFHADG